MPIEVDKMEALLDCLGDWRANIDEALHVCCNKPHSGRLVAALLDRGANIEARGADGHTPLIHARATRNVPVIKVLLKHGADATVNADDESIFHIAIKSGLCAFRPIAMLSENGANVNATNNLGETALHWASLQNSVRAVRTLLGVGADPNIKSFTGQTPLHLACPQGKAKVVCLLMAAGADPTIKDLIGRRPIEATNNPQALLERIKAADPQVAMDLWCLR